MNVQKEITTFHLEEMCCADEERCIRKALDTVDGIQTLKFDLLSRNIIIHHSCSRHVLADMLRNTGFPPRLVLDQKVQQSFLEQHQYLLLTTISGALTALGLLAARSSLPPTVPHSIFILAIISGGWKIFLKAIQIVKQRVLDMNVLMSMAVVGAVAIDKFEEGAAVIFLFSLSNLIERASTEHVRMRIRSLLKISPATATRIQDGTHQTIEVEKINTGDRLLIRPGERIPLDGIVTSGESLVDQAPISGESRPVKKRPRDEVYAGTLNGHGAFEIEVTRPYYDTTLARIVRKVEEAQAERAPVQTTGEKFAQYYTPTVVALAVLVAVIPPLVFYGSFYEWFYRALVLLVIACPCALVISTPVTIVCGIANAAKNGVLVKGGRHLEAMASVHAIAFDKTGTLTTGTAHVTDVIPLDSLPPERIIQLAATIESKSDHPLAGAVLKKAFEENISFDRSTYQQFEALAGLGVTAKIDGESYFIGNHALVERMHVCSPKIESILQKLEAQGKTTIIIGTTLEPFGVIGIMDGIRPESATTVAQLHSMGIKKTIMLTGDNKDAANEIALNVGVDEVHAELLPQMKTERVASLKERYGKVAMVGDGINDAPALASSTVGIAMGSSGSDIAMETADVVLMSDDLSKLPYIINVGRKAISIIKQNIAFILLIKMVFIGFGITGGVSLWLAVFADDGATLLVLLNSMRSLRLQRNGVR